ncbi:MAG: hypothetical protein ACR2KK_18880 [Acidimicrobiales bacterium]
MRRFVRSTGAELRKLVHPVVGLLVVVTALAIWMDIRSTVGFVADQTPIAADFDDRLRAEADPACFTSPPDASERCELQRADEEANRLFRPNAVALGRIAASLDTPGGALRFVSNELATGIGWLLLAALAAVHVAGEWQAATAEATILAVGGRCRFYVAKALSLWLGVGVLLVTIAGALYLARPLFMRRTIGVPDPPLQTAPFRSWKLTPVAPDGSWSSLPRSLGYVAAALGVLLVLTLVFVSVAALVRRPLATAATLAGALLLLVVVAASLGRPALTPFVAVADLLDLRQVPPGITSTRLWVVPGAARNLYVPPPGSADGLLVILGWATGLAALGIGMERIFQRRRVV